MISFLIDTDWAIDYLNGRGAAAQLFSSLAEQGIGISILTYAELYEGALGSTDPDRRLAQLQDLTEAVDVVPFDLEAAREFAQIRLDLRRLGQPIPDMDVLIAATALRNDVTLIARDQHSGRVPNLKLRTS